MTGLSKGMLSKIENMQASPSLATLARLSVALKVPVTAFFRGLNEEQDVLHIKAGRGLEIDHKGSGPGHLYQSLGTMRAPLATARSTNSFGAANVCANAAVIPVSSGGQASGSNR